MAKTASRKFDFFPDWFILISFCFRWVNTNSRWADLDCTARFVRPLCRSACSPPTTVTSVSATHEILRVLINVVTGSIILLLLSKLYYIRLHWKHQATTLLDMESKRANAYHLRALQTTPTDNRSQQGTSATNSTYTI